MRTLPTDEQQQRREKILQAVVHLYVKSGKPVGSSSIVENFKVHLSPASIRNVLADLETEGFLTHPHTSAGRIPTDKGYRFFVDAIANIQRLAMEEEQRIRSEYLKRIREIEDLMLSTTRILSALSHCTAFVVKPTLESERLRRVELIPVNQNTVLGVLISESGFVKNHMIKVNQLPDEEVLRTASRFLSEKLAGRTFSEAQSSLLMGLDQFTAHHTAQKEFFESLTKNLFEEDDRNNLFVEGASNLLNFPEFQDYESMRNFARMVDQKKALMEILNREIDQQGLNVKIGLESAPELKDFSVVSSCYLMHGKPVGVLGILGPKRMEYERIMSIVNAVAEHVNEYLDAHGTPLLEDNQE